MIVYCNEHDLAIHVFYDAVRRAEIGEACRKDYFNWKHVIIPQDVMVYAQLYAKALQYEVELQLATAATHDKLGYITWEPSPEEEDTEWDDPDRC